MISTDCTVDDIVQSDRINIDDSVTCVSQQFLN